MFTGLASKKRGIAFGLILLFVSVSTLGLLGFAEPARAQWVVSAPTLEGMQIADKVELNTENALLAASLGALVQGASYFMRKLAYDSAQFIAHGGKGKGALAFQEGFGPYLAQTLGDSTATIIGEFGKPFGLNLCSIPDINLMAQIQMGLQEFYDLKDGKGPQPTCSLQQLIDGWDGNAWKEKYGKDAMDAKIEQFFDQALVVRNTDFGITLEAMASIDRIRAREREAAIYNRQEGDGFKPIVDAVAGYTRTPSQVVAEEAKGLTGKHAADISASQIAGIYGSGALQVLPMAGSVFLNTLVGELLNQILGDGLLPSPAGGATTNAGVLEFYGESLVDKKLAAEKAFNFLFTTVPQKQLTSFDMAAQMLACPDNPGINNCVLDSGLHEAIIRARNGKPLTIQEALDEKLLRADWLLISPNRVADNTNIKNCVVGKYCYSNIQKLRKVRVVPLGFEIAALKSNPDTPWKLGDVVKGFEDCAEGNVPDPNHPYCHLIDPNWTIRMPETRCEANVYTSELVDPLTPNRRQECVDVSTCIEEGPNGECLGRYGYCLKEKKVWQLPGESCPAEFNTCKTYKTESNQLVSYLSRTLDYGTCNAGSVGCTAYSTEQANGTWAQSGIFDAAKKLVGRNGGAYLNGTASQYSCGVADEGCTAFYGSSVNLLGQYTKDMSKLVHLKKAPGYLNCYDTDPATPQIEWPVTKADLNKITTNPACNTFANVCLPEEVGCQEYIPKDGGINIPGIVGNNACSASCVGYDTFKQEATYFEPSKNPLYFIPQNGQQCSAQFAGCDEFTNLEGTVQGGEQKEYYTYIKQCEKPAGDNAKTFYSWEGTVTEGYVLKTHSLKQIKQDDSTYITNLTISDEIKTELKIGSPAYADDTATKLVEAYGFCNKAVYDGFINDPNSLLKFDPDCRALYDDAGNISYRLLSRTVTVSPACRQLRKTVSNFFVDANLTDKPACDDKNGKFENNSCLRCTNGGRYDETKNACVYNAIPGAGESQMCPAAANGCRVYSGNTGAYEKTIIDDKFEPIGETPDAFTQAKAGWAGTANVANESLQVGLHSLQVGGNGIIIKEIAPGEFEHNQWYEITFWARGAGQALKVSMVQGATSSEFTFDPLTQTSYPVGVNTDWKLYRLGPTQFTGSVTVSTTVRFEMTKGGGIYYLDNIVLRRIEDTHYLIKESWKTAEGYDAPLVCDSTPQDGFPGEALGCREYTEKATNNKVYATGFEALCREAAIGCQPVFDTFNTVGEGDGEKAQIIKAKCQNASVVSSSTACERLIGGTKYSCVIEAGKDSCFVTDPVVIPDPSYIANNIFVLVDGKSANSYAAPNDVLIMDISSLFIPADTPSTTPVFLTVTQDTICKASARGCTKVGRETENIQSNTTAGKYSYADTYLRLDLTLFTGTNSILCRQDQVGCGKFTSDNQTAFFKDPAKTGQSLCEYKALSPEHGVAKSGWYKTGVGACSNSPAGTQVECREDANCGTGGTCNKSALVACYPGYTLTGGGFGIYSNESPSYGGYVGTCQSEYSGCTELIDRYDNNKAYYSIYDNRLTGSAKTCGGQASLEEGCVLFDRTELPNKNFDTAATYKKSADKQGDKYGLVAPVSGTTNDANVLLKVDRDRVCSEWLDCRAKDTVTLPNGKTVEICLDYRACRESNGISCTNIIEDWEQTEVEKFIDENLYVARSTAWNGEEYTGYSLFNSFQVNNLGYLLVNGKTYIGYKFSDAAINTATDNSGNPGDKFKFGCSKSDGTLKADLDSCGLNQGGICYDGGCYYPLNKKQGIETNDNLEKTFNPLVCKAAPQKDSPFATDYALSSIAASDKTIDYLVFKEKKPGYEGANICQDGECSCRYTRVQYKGGVSAFWSSAASAQKNIPGICMAGSVGSSCYSNEDCGKEGVCEKDEGAILSQSTHIGTQGYCLEVDRSRPIYNPVTKQVGYTCLTWLPLDTNPVGIDTYNYFEEAGFFPAVDSGGNWNGLYCRNAIAASQVDADLESVSGVLGSIFQPECIVDIGAEILPITEACGKEKAYGCAEVSLSSSAFFACSDSNNASKNFAYLMQEKGLVLLRAEVGSWNGIDEPGDDNNGTLAKLLPPEEQFTPGDKTGGNDSQAGRVILRHPPMQWSPNEVFDEFFITGGKTANDSKGDDVVYNSVIAAPGNKIWPKKNMEEFKKRVYRSPYEGILNISDLRKVYFVPSMYTAPNCNSCDTPRIGSKELVLDFGVEFYKKPLLEINTVLHKGENFPDYVEVKGGGQSTVYQFIYDREDTDNNAEVVSVLDRHYQGKEISEENTIYKRYLLVWVENSSNIEDSQANALTQNARWLPKGNVGVNGLVRDPFDGGDVRCEWSSAYQDHNWWALAMDFNKEGQFLGYSSRLCNPNNDLTGQEEYYGVNLVIAAEIKNVCSEIDSVYDSSPDPAPAKTPIQNDKAWTNRVWNSGSFDLNSYLLANVLGNGNYNTDIKNLNFPVSKNNEVVPYGALKNVAENSLTSGNKILGINRSGLSVDVFAEDGVPYACKNWLPGFTVPSLDVNCVSQNTGSDDYWKDLGHVMSKNTVNQGNSLSREIFAKVFDRYSVLRNADNGDLTSVAGSLFGNDDISGDRSSFQGTFFIPQIYSINPAVCGDQNKNCVPGEKDNLTISGKNGNAAADYNGDGIKDEDPYGLGTPLVHVAVNSFYAQAKFFAFVDDNRMPIRRVWVDWRDSNGFITNDQITGKYKNAKPYCGVSVGHCGVKDKNNITDISLLTCNTDADCKANGSNWTCIQQNDGYFNNTNKGIVGQNYDLDSFATARFGDDEERSCTPAPFSYSYIYDCTETKAFARLKDSKNTPSNLLAATMGSLTQQVKNQIKLLGIDPDSQENAGKPVCIFKPRVQVLDNWGWCNGSCGATSPNGLGCYNDYSGYPINRECDWNSGVDSIQPSYTEYKGNIIVIPK